MILLPKLNETLFPNDEFSDYKGFILKTRGGCTSIILDNAICEHFKKCLDLSPEVTEEAFPYTYSYVKDPKNKNTAEIKKETADIEIYLQKGEVIYHGGTFNDLNIGSSIVIDEVFSTTSSVHNAVVHPVKVEKNILIIELSKNARVLPIPSYIQGEEYEFLILDGLNLEIMDIQNISYTNIIGEPYSIKFIFTKQII